MLGDGAIDQNRNSVGQRLSVGDVVGDEDHRLAMLGVQCSNQRSQFSASRCVDRAKRFIKQQHLGSDTQRPGQRHALLFAARQPVDRVGASVAQSNTFEQLSSTCVPFGSVNPAHPQAEADVVGHAESGKQSRVLEQQCGGPILRSEPGLVDSVDLDRTTIGFDEPGDCSQ